MVSTDHQGRLQQGADRAQELATFFEQDTRKILSIADVYVREARRIYVERQNIGAVKAFFGGLLAGNETISHLSMIGPDGTPRLVTGYQFNPASSATDAPYFQFQRDTPGDQVYISLPHESQMTGDLVICLVRRITLPDGSFGGVMVAAIEAEKFTAFYNTLNLGEKSSATLVGLDKRIRARSSWGRVGPGQDISGSRLWTELAQRDVGLYRQTSVVDGVPRFYAYRKMPDYPLLVAMGLAEIDVSQGADTFARPVYAIAALTTLIIIVLTTMICRDALVKRRLENEIEVRKAAQKELGEANADLKQFAYAASHDLKAPLSSINGLLDFCKDDIANSQLDDALYNLEQAKQIGTRSALKIESLLRLAYTGANKADIEKFSLAPMIQNIWRDQTASLGAEREIVLELDLDGPVETEKTTLNMILENLISNAVRYRDEAKDRLVVRVKSMMQDNQLAISVTDNGVGIPEKLQGSVFEMFKRADDRSGDGLGLALVRKQIDRLGGMITVNSKEGQGSEFRLVLPNP